MTTKILSAKTNHYPITNSRKRWDRDAILKRFADRVGEKADDVWSEHGMGNGVWAILRHGWSTCGAIEDGRLVHEETWAELAMALERDAKRVAA